MAACDSGRPIVPVVILDDSVKTLGAAPKWRWGLGVEHLARSLADMGSKLIFRSGDALSVLRALIAETGARAVYWSRLYDPDAVARDTAVKAALKEDGIEARSFGGHLMFEPWTAETKTGGYYKVYTPFWRSVKDRDVDAPLPLPARIFAPDQWPASDLLDDWNLGAAMKRGAEVVRLHLRLGETAALSRLGHFIETGIASYGEGRNIPAEDRTSNLSENLALGEISPNQCWHAGLRALHEGKAGAEVFLKELVWREFAYHLMHHTPRILDRNWKENWDRFPVELG